MTTTPSKLAIIDALADGRRLTGAELRAASGVHSVIMYATIMDMVEAGEMMQTAAIEDRRYWIGDAAAGAA